jgi:hypothetical protein
MGIFKNTLFWKAVLVALAAPRLHAQNATDNATGNATGNTTGNATVTPALPLCSELQAAADAAAGNSTGNATAECVIIIASLARRVSVGGFFFFFPPLLLLLLFEVPSCLRWFRSDPFACFDPMWP